MSQPTTDQPAQFIGLEFVSGLKLASSVTRSQFGAWWLRAYVQDPPQWIKFATGAHTVFYNREHLVSTFTLDRLPEEPFWSVGDFDPAFVAVFTATETQARTQPLNASDTTALAPIAHSLARLSLLGEVSSIGLKEELGYLRQYQANKLAAIVLATATVSAADAYVRELVSAEKK